MGFSYSGDPSSSTLDYIRFTVGDTVETTAVLQDDEIAWIITEYPELNKQLAASFRQIATKYATVATMRKLGPQEENTMNRLNYFKARAAYYERLSSLSGIPPLPEYSAELVFDKGMMSNDE